MNQGADFSDLLPRILSAMVLLAVGLGALWVGGDVWGVLLIAAAGLMGWEVSRMHCDAAQVQLIFGVLIAATVLAWLFLTPVWALPCAVLAAGVAVAAHKSVGTVLGWGAAIVVTAVVLVILRSGWGLPAALWLLLVVIAADVGGYFAGKLIGGPKILPRISPKKTWSGTVGGWVLAAAVGAVAWQMQVGGVWMVALSVLLAIASQTGDLMESLMKRRAGVKDSSALIPGHGGLLDRFDGTVGASVVMGAALLTGIAG